MKNENWSEQDKLVNKLTGFVPADRSERQCITCGEKGHYYYDYGGAEFCKHKEAYSYPSAKPNEMYCPDCHTFYEESKQA